MNYNELITRIDDNGFDISDGILDVNNGTGLLRLVNTAHTCFLIIKIDNVGLVDGVYLIDENDILDRISNYSMLPVLEYFDYELFMDEGYKAYDTKSFFRKLKYIDKLEPGENKEITLEIRGECKYSIVNAKFLKSCLLNKENISNLYFKISKGNHVLIKYNSGEFEVYCVIAGILYAYGGVTLKI